MAINLTSFKLNLSVNFAVNGLYEMYDIETANPIYKLMIENIYPVSLSIYEVELNWVDIYASAQEYFISQTPSLLDDGTDFTLDFIKVVINEKYVVVFKSYDAFETACIVKS